MEVDQIITEYEPDRLITWQHEAERLDGQPAPKMARLTKFSIRLLPEGQGTRVQLESQQAPVNIFTGLMIRLVGKPMVAQSLEKSLQKLGEIVKGRSTQELSKRTTAADA
jgi:hypothetical protein